jgi:hypothetical protein
MRLQVLTLMSAAALACAGIGRLPAQQLYTPSANIVLTDPLVRSVQIGPAPVGLATAYNPATGLGLVAIPGVGVRRAQLVGVPVPWSGGLAVNAVDLDTGVQFAALLPTRPQLVQVRVVRSIGDSILVRRRSGNALITEAVPVGSVFASTKGGLAPATRVTGALQPGSTVLIPLSTRSRAVVVVQHSEVR